MIPDGEGIVGWLEWDECGICVHDVDGDCGHEDLYIDRDAEAVRCRGFREEES